MSPLSAQVVLSLTYEGAAGQTAQAMNTALDLVGQSQQDVINDFNSLMTSLLEVDGNTTLNIANKIYINDTFQINPDYQSVADQFFSAVESIDFLDNVDAANEINAWASQETGGNIPKVVDADEFNSATTMLLLNAIYFKGVWLKPFATSQTRQATFYPSKTTTQQIQFMNIETSFSYGYIGDLHATALQLPYSDPTLTMLFILPNDRNGLANTIAALGNTNIGSILGDVYPREVIVSIPKFTITTAINLNNALSQIGMGIIFTPEADFSGILQTLSSSNYDSLVVSAVTQNAFIEVNEEGAKAAAVTVVHGFGMARPALPPPPPTRFNANHPFLYMILKNNEVLFIGTFIKGDSSIVPITSTTQESSSSDRSISSSAY